MLERLLRPGTTMAYHGVGEVDDAADPATLVVSPQHLRDHLHALRRRGYRFGTLDEVLEGGRPEPGTVVLTFDDGWASALDLVVPALREVDATATFYVCPGWFGGQHPDVTGPAGRIMEAADVVALVDAGMDVGSHTLTHPDLRTCDDGELERQLVGARTEIERLTGRACTSFAYPFGLFDDRVEDAVAATGHELAWAWLPGPWRDTAAPRLPAPCRHGAARLHLKLLGVRRFWTR